MYCTNCHIDLKWAHDNIDLNHPTKVLKLREEYYQRYMEILNPYLELEETIEEFTVGSATSEADLILKVGMVVLVFVISILASLRSNSLAGLTHGESEVQLIIALTNKRVLLAEIKRFMGMIRGLKNMQSIPLWDIVNIEFVGSGRLTIRTRTEVLSFDIQHESISDPAISTMMSRARDLSEIFNSLRSGELTF